MAQTGENDHGRPPLKVVVGANVYRLRVLRVPKWSQKDLAEAAHVSDETVRLLEQGRDPSRKGLATGLDTVDALAKALEVDPSELLRWDERSRVYVNAERPAFELLAGEGLEAGTGNLPLMGAVH